MKSNLAAVSYTVSLLPIEEEDGTGTALASSCEGGVLGDSEDAPLVLVLTSWREMIFRIKLDVKC